MPAQQGNLPVTFRAPDDDRILAIYLPRGLWRQRRSGRAGAAEPAPWPACLTPRDWPLQLSLITRPAGTLSPAHYHLPTGPVQLPTRHQVMVCLSGMGRIAVHTRTGLHVATADLQRGDVILLTEGHAVEYVKPDTVFVEIKQGPGPERADQDKIPVGP